MKSNLYIIGKIPPPIGGITVHVRNLVHLLNKSNINFYFIELKKFNLIKFFINNIFNRSIIHLHTASHLLRLIFTLYCLITKNELIITLHANIDRYKGLSYFMDYFSFRFCTTLIVLNETSYKNGMSMGFPCIMIGAYLETDKSSNLPSNFNEVVKKTSQFEKIFSTNASRRGFDDSNNEIYGIESLVKLFSLKDNQKYCLLISDSSKENYNYLSKKYIFTDNIIFITELHDFNHIISISDCIIRYTSTDGDSLTIHESLAQNKNVIATNVVDRPKDVVLINRNIEELQNKVHSFKKIKHNNKIKTQENFDKLLNLYNQLLID